MTSVLTVQTSASGLLHTHTHTAGERGALAVVAEVRVRNFEPSVVWNML
jgi:hypothetical protein